MSDPSDGSEGGAWASPGPPPPAYGVPPPYGVPPAYGVPQGGMQPSPATRRRPRWVVPLVVVGVLAVAGLSILGFLALRGFESGPRGTGSPTEAARLFHESREQHDCEQFRLVTTEEYRNANFAWNCAEFEAFLQRMEAFDAPSYEIVDSHPGSDGTYEVDVLWTFESGRDPMDNTLVLVRDGDTWVVDWLLLDR